MRNLMTQKIVFGLLMAFVLALGMQGISDALTLTKGSGDLLNANDDTTFTITFTPTLVVVQC